MKKKEYSAPTMKTIMLKRKGHLLTGSAVGTRVYSKYAEDDQETL